MHPQTHDMGGNAVKNAIDEGSYIRRDAAAEYLRQRYGHGSPRTLAKLAVTGGGPRYVRSGTRMVLYRREDLDEWAMSKITPAQSSTSESPAPARRRANII